MEQNGTSSPLTDAVRELSAQLVSALASGGHSPVSAGTAVTIGDDELGLAAVRVVGADVLLPSVLHGTPPAPVDLAVCEKAVLAYPPGPDASATSMWSHWAMTRTLAGLGAPAAGAAPDGAEPDATWLEDLPWQALTHQLALLAALAVPAADNAVARVAGSRTVDLARGFVRAVRRRGWLQAAGAGRWLALLDGVPDTLGLDAGLDFVAGMGGDDPRVALHVRAARLLRPAAGVEPL
ncbi:hypothetical protein E2C00_03180 [Streptomyces sp. WAC05374]|uniref:hypothetical protein n=1 Tax=Streptomyces sp. WAC05374 TaxID=2487420 RepID=UPI000F87758B|nr:hypothetical protein [Streptomyces sp. WAC05374]RST02729.1 hypothetical protein EF905_34590 [Streptomyces sp. WAC05374]TDF50502.1 hypothetical protein E2B92_03160 [Streptomyces sp. WAC05374]TDF51870.1 hypothetical protein E2C02_23345 [Streptomyces sp. WAC05374]TDF60756.1 hypothetical protein E2C00_03180 [Streptomyces sp. WAC05374]